tara:strand:+ start:111 stop:1019 length:909 start_codon:yes stop_codon:yes gene_type:complete
MCNCGCDTCETKGPLLTEGKVKSLLSEGLQYHIDKKIPLFENIYRIGSNKHLALIKEARKMYSRNVIELCEDDEALIKTHLGEFALYEGESIPLDLPMLNKESISEKLKGIDGKACWKGYKLAGTKKKNGKTVDNCVPMEESLNEKEGVPHFTKDGKEWKGKVHKMPDGSLMSGNPHDENGSGPNDKSEKLYHKEDLNEDKKDIPSVSEAEFKGKKVALGKPKRGGSKAYYVYVKDGDKVKKVTFGSGGLRAKIKNKEARNAFAARHKCKTKKDRTKAGYWSCNLPRYASQLGLGANQNTFW